MSRAERLAIGLILGALFALFAFPESRFLFLNSLQFGPSPLRKAPELVENKDRLSKPTNPTQRWQWVETGFRRLARRQKIEPGTLDELVRITQLSAKSDPQNAYWPLAESTFLLAHNQRPEAQAAWLAASQKTAWADPQDKILKSIASRLGNASWVYAGLLSRRSSAAAARTSAQARETVRGLGFGPNDLDTRYKTLKVGSAIREGARSVESGEFGIRIVEYATFPPDIFGFRSPRKLIVARTDFSAKLNQANRPVESEIAENAFRANDAWMALAGPEGQDSRRPQLTALSLLPSAAPAGLLGAVLISGLLWAMGARMRPWSERLFHRKWVPLWVLLAAAPWVIFGLNLAALAIGSCVAMTALSPRTVRTEVDEPAGGAYRLSVTLLALVLVLTLTAFVGGLSVPGSELATALDLPEEWIGWNPVIPGLASLAFGLSMLLPPAMAYTLKQPTSRLVAIVIRDLARATCSLALGLLVLGAAPLLLLERSISQDLSQMLENEPLHLLTR